MSVKEFVSVLFSIFLAIATIYLGMQIISQGIFGIKKKKMRVWTEGNSKKSYLTYTGKGAIGNGIFSIVLGVGLVIFGIFIIYKIINQ